MLPLESSTSSHSTLALSLSSLSLSLLFLSLSLRSTSAEQSVHRQRSPCRRRQTDHRVVDELGRDLDRVSSGARKGCQRSTYTRGLGKRSRRAVPRLGARLGLGRQN